MMKFFKSIPGYRSGKGWKIAISTIYYALVLLMAVIVEDIGTTFILLSLPFILFGFMSLVKQKKPLIFIIGILAFIIGFILLGATDDGETTSGTQSTVNPTPTIEATPTAEPMPTPTAEPTAEPVHESTETSSESWEDELDEMEKVNKAEKERTGYMGSCYSATYDELARNPENYKNRHIYVRGKVAQIISENGLNVLIRINITASEFDTWTDDVVITYTRQSANESRILEGDIIDVYGAYEGIKSYKSAISDTNFNVPQIQAKYIL